MASAIVVTVAPNKALFTGDTPRFASKISSFCICTSTTHTKVDRANTANDGMPTGKVGRPFLARAYPISRRHSSHVRKDLIANARTKVIDHGTRRDHAFHGRVRTKRVSGLVVSFIRRCPP